MLIHAVNEIAGDAGVEGAVFFVGHDVDGGGFFHDNACVILGVEGFFNCFGGVVEGWIASSLRFSQ